MAIFRMDRRERNAEGREMSQVVNTLAQIEVEYKKEGRVIEGE